MGAGQPRAVAWDTSAPIGIINLLGEWIILPEVSLSRDRLSLSLHS